MLSTELTINTMPTHLKAFRKYIEKYECSYHVTKDGHHGLLFYHKNGGMPYLMVLDRADLKSVIIYANYKGDNWFNEPKIKEENIISNDMRKFIEAIRECKES